MKTIQISLFTLLFALISFVSFSQTGYKSDKFNTENENEHKVIIYPNPSLTYKFNVKSDELIVSVEVLNVIGQRITKVVNETGVPYNVFVNLPDCEEGVYLVRITFGDNKVVIKKVMIK